jgi:hypothetical protein
MSRSQQKNQSRLRSSQRLAKQAERRYSIQSDGDHDYFVEVGMEGEFEHWLSAEENHGLRTEIGYSGHDYEENRIDGRFTFTDPRNE